MSKHVIRDLDEADGYIYGLVVDAGTAAYEIVVDDTTNDGAVIGCYSIRNKETGVAEYQTTNLAKAKWAMKHLQDDLTYGFDRGARSAAPPGFFAPEVGEGRSN